MVNFSSVIVVTAACAHSSCAKSSRAITTITTISVIDASVSSVEAESSSVAISRIGTVANPTVPFSIKIFD